LGKQIAARNNSVLNFFVGNWSVNAITVIQTGFPLAISQNSNNNRTIGTSVQRRTWSLALIRVSAGRRKITRCYS